VLVGCLACWVARCCLAFSSRAGSLGVLHGCLISAWPSASSYLPPSVTVTSKNPAGRHLPPSARVLWAHPGAYAAPQPPPSPGQGIAAALGQDGWQQQLVPAAASLQRSSAPLECGALAGELVRPSPPPQLVPWRRISWAALGHAAFLFGSSSSSRGWEAGLSALQHCLQLSSSAASVSSLSSGLPP